MRILKWARKCICGCNVFFINYLHSEGILYIKSPKSGIATKITRLLVIEFTHDNSNTQGIIHKNTVIQEFTNIVI